MIDLRITAPGLEGLAHAFREANAESALAKAEATWSMTMLEKLRRATPLSHGPGPHARESWRAERSEHSVRLTNTVPWAIYLVTGTRPHEIVARNGVLRWFTEGTPTFARRVEHPGTAPIPDLVEVIDHADEEAAEALEKATDAFAEHLTTGGL